MNVLFFYQKHMEPLGIDRAGADALVAKFVTDPITKLHLLETEAIMRALAKKFGEDAEAWAIIGLLHDIDWDLTKEDTKNHTVKAVEILREAGATDFFIHTMQSHAFGLPDYEETYAGKARQTRLEHCLLAAETVTGLIAAAALVQPDKKLASVKLSSLRKKFKNKAFAGGCNRDLIMECEKFDMELEDFLGLSLVALQEIAPELGM